MLSIAVLYTIFSTEKNQLTWPLLRMIKVPFPKFLKFDFEERKVADKELFVVVVVALAC